jgi:hypothetical protein
MEQSKSELWTGVYYPKELIKNQRAKTLLCILFDRIVCHFPIAGFLCGGGMGISQEFEDDPLVKAGVIQLEEEILLDEVDEMFADAPTDGFWPADFEHYVDLQVTGMALAKAGDSSFVPVTDNSGFQVPALILGKFEVTRNAHLQAVAAAIASIDMVLPPIASLHDEDILQLRDLLADHLVPFRSAMLELAPRIRSYLESGAQLADVHKEAQYVVDTVVSPVLADCKARLEKEKSTFWRRVILKGAGVLPRFVLNWAEKSLIAAAVDGVTVLSHLGEAAIEHEVLLENMKRRGGLGFLLKLEGQIRKKSVQQTD